MNIEAAKAVADAVRTSLGPRGMDKMVASASGEVVITNDGATILNKMTLEQPAAKMLVDLSRSQDVVAGDGTTSVVVICGALLKKSLELLDRGVHPTVISDAFNRAAAKAVEVRGEGGGGGCGGGARGGGAAREGSTPASVGSASVGAGPPPSCPHTPARSAPLAHQPTHPGAHRRCNPRGPGRPRGAHSRRRHVPLLKGGGATLWPAGAHGRGRADARLRPRAPRHGRLEGCQGGLAGLSLSLSLSSALAAAACAAPPRAPRPDLSHSPPAPAPCPVPALASPRWWARPAALSMTLRWWRAWCWTSLLSSRRGGPRAWRTRASRSSSSASRPPRQTWRTASSSATMQPWTACSRCVRRVVGVCGVVVGGGRAAWRRAVHGRGGEGSSACGRAPARAHPQRTRNTPP